MILLIYFISVTSAAISLWIWYSTERERDEIGSLKRKNQELERKINEIYSVKRLNAGADAFKRR